MKCCWERRMNGRKSKSCPTQEVPLGCPVMVGGDSMGWKCSTAPRRHSTVESSSRADGNRVPSPEQEPSSALCVFLCPAARTHSQTHRMHNPFQAAPSGDISGLWILLLSAIPGLLSFTVSCSAEHQNHKICAISIIPLEQPRQGAGLG